jgi:hypothetical protein
MTRQGVVDLDGARNGRRHCTHAWSDEDRHQIDEDGSEYRVQGEKCGRCNTWRPRP